MCRVFLRTEVPVSAEIGRPPFSASVTDGRSVGLKANWKVGTELTTRMAG
jgi:hypothetical protein